jgi:hypothetical protein
MKSMKSTYSNEEALEAEERILVCRFNSGRIRCFGGLQNIWREVFYAENDAE